MVVHWTTMALTGNKLLGQDFGKGAQETATTSKEGRRRVMKEVTKIIRMLGLYRSSN